ncbi:MAG: SLBB domain-containing protein [Prevotella sp.]|nr:SLBB domain-containing protein [Prevotella sp.]
MKKPIILLLMLLMLPLCTMAQSSMTDEQVFKYIIKEHQEGTSQQQIVVQLMQRGVDINQIRRVRKKYERMAKEQGLGTMSNNTEGGTDRTRKNKKSPYQDSDYDDKLSDNRTNSSLYNSGMRVKEENFLGHTYDEDDEDFLEFQEELDDWLPGDTITMYENLVEKLKKQKKKIYGHDLFNNKKLSFEPNMNIATPETYRLGPGDAVYIDIYGASQKTIEGIVSPDGNVTIEGYGPIHVGGMTVSQANATIKQRLGSRYESSKLRLTVGETRSIMVNVLGDVKTPGTYTLSAFATVFHALYMAGGVTDLGTLRNVKIYRNSQLLSVVDIYDYLLNGRLSGNVRLQDNDMVMVGTYESLVNIGGKVKRPMYYEMKRNESLSALLKYSGGFTGDAYKKSVRVIRKTGREYTIHTVDEFDFNSFTLSDGDSISVDSIIDRFSNMVEVKGAVFRPGMYEVGQEIGTVRSLIEHAEGLKEEAFTPHAVMHRMKPDRTLEVVQIDIEGIMSGSLPDVSLRPNDVLFIPTRQEMMEDQTITIHGEVHYPGVYKYASNETLEDFILQAGGLTETASTVKVDIARRVSNPSALTTDSIIANTFSFALKDGFVIDGEPGFTLIPFDEVYVRKSPGSYKQQNVMIEGEVMFSGTYTISTKDMRISDLVAVAGGLNDRAYALGARLERRYTQEERLNAIEALKKAREQAELNLQEQIARSGNANLMNMTQTQQLQKYEVGDTYPVGIDLDKALKQPGCDDDIVLREGDRIIVPQYTGTVKISGEVMHPNSVAYEMGKNVSYYIDQAGGFGSLAKKRQAYIIYMNGKVAKVNHKAKPMPGCEIVVPSKSITRTSLQERLSMATAIGSLSAIIATIISVVK